MRDADRYDEGAEATRTKLPGDPAEGPRRRTGAARVVAPLVLIAAAALLLVALVTAASTLRAPLPATATLPAVAATGGSAPTSAGSVAAAPTETDAEAASKTSAATRTPTTMPSKSSDGAPRSGDSSGASQELKRIAAEHENRPQGQVYVILFDLTEGADHARLKTASGSSTWQAEDILSLYRQRAAAWPGAVLQARPQGDKTSWRLTVSNPQWRSPSEAQKWCDGSFAQYDGEDRTSRCRVSQG